MLIFDIETGPLPDEVLLTIWQPPEMPEPPGDFDPKSVRIGNLKDQAKIDAKIEAARQAHESEAGQFESKCEAIAESSWSDFKGRAALDATTGQVIAIGYYNPDSDACLADHDESEAKLIARFWDKASECRHARRSIVGLNTHDFDLPFLMRRSWLLDVSVPGWVIKQDRFWSDIFVDLRKRWLCGQYGRDVRSNFDHLGKAFGTGGKIDGVDGSMFATLFEEDRPRAIEYLLNDLTQPAEWARRMGVV